MGSLSKACTYAAWVVAALVAAAARPASAEIFDRFGQPSGPTTEIPSRAEVFNEAYSFSDEEPAVFDSDTAFTTPDQRVEDSWTTPGDAAYDDALLLIGTWAWEGVIEGVPAYIETTFYDDGTYESYATTTVIDLYETGIWSLDNGTLRAEVTDYYPHVIQTPYGPQPVPMEPVYMTDLSFVDEDTVMTDIGLSYRVY